LLAKPTTFSPEWWTDNMVAQW